MFFFMSLIGLYLLYHMFSPKNKQISFQDFMNDHMSKMNVEKIVLEKLNEGYIAHIHTKDKQIFDLQLTSVENFLGKIDGIQRAMNIDPSWYVQVEN